jgi:hypothetical protein
MGEGGRLELAKGFDEKRWHDHDGWNSWEPEQSRVLPCVARSSDSPRAVRAVGAEDAERARWRPALVASLPLLVADLWACGVTRRSASQVAAEPRRAAVRRDQGFPSCPPASYEPGFFSAMKLHRWLTRDGPPDVSHGEDVW